MSESFRDRIDRVSERYAEPEPETLEAADELVARLEEVWDDPPELRRRAMAACADCEEDVKSLIIELLRRCGKLD